MEDSKQEINEIAARHIDRIGSICAKIKPLVVINCCTYNQAPYLRDTLEGFVMQQTSFPFVAVVHDDASTDNTAQILKEYADRYPDIILPIFDKENQYSKPDGSLGRIMHIACRETGAKYLAFCEGDDYWTDKHKLQMQVEFLENNPEYGMCYAYANRRKGASGTLEKDIYGDERCSFYELLTGDNNIPTLTTVLRWDIRERYRREVQPWKHRWRMGDLPMWLFAAGISKIKCFPQCVGVYRMLHNSACHFDSVEKYIRFTENANDIKLFFNKNYNGDDQKTRRLINYSFVRFLSIQYNLYDPSLKPVVRQKISSLDLSIKQRIIVNMSLLSFSKSLMSSLIKTGSFVKRKILRRGN